MTKNKIQAITFDEVGMNKDLFNQFIKALGKEIGKKIYMESNEYEMDKKKGEEL